MKRLAVISLLGTMVMSSLLGCGSKPTNIETPVKSLENVIAEADRISLSEEQVSGELKPLEHYEVYFHFSDDYKAKADETLEQYLSEGMPEADACIKVLGDLIYEAHENDKAFVATYMIDEDQNGVYDSVERGEIMQEEIDHYLEKWYAPEEQKVVDYAASRVKNNEMTIEEAEQYIEDFFNASKE